MDETRPENGALTPQLPPSAPKRTFLLSLEQFQAHLAQLTRDAGGTEEVGRRLGVTDKFIYALIAGKRRPGKKLLGAIGARRRVMIEIDVEVE